MESSSGSLFQQAFDQHVPVADLGDVEIESCRAKLVGDLADGECGAERVEEVLTKDRILVRRNRVDDALSGVAGGGPQ